MEKSCENCIHYNVCKYKYRPSDPEPMKKIWADDCKDYVPVKVK